MKRWITIIVLAGICSWLYVNNVQLRNDNITMANFILHKKIQCERWMADPIVQRIWKTPVPKQLLD